MRSEVTDPYGDAVSNSRSRSWAGDRVGLAILVLLVTIYGVFFTLLTVQRHRTYGTHAYDLANMDQAVWNTLRGRVLSLSTMDVATTRLGFHFEPILIALSPLYLLYESAETLLVVQTIALALGAIPVYLLAYRSFGFQWAALAFALAYLLYPPMQAANNYDFHPVALATPLLLFAFYYQEREMPWLTLLFAVLAMMCKEDVPLLIVMLGIYRLLAKRDWRGGATLCLLGIVWFVVAFGVVIPYFLRQTSSAVGYSSYHSRYAHLGDGPVDMLISLVRAPQKWVQLLTSASRVRYYRNLLLPLAFLPIFAPHVLLLAAPALAINLLSAFPSQHIVDEYHYASTIVPFSIGAAVVATDWLSRLAAERFGVRRERLLLLPVLAILATTLLAQYYRGYSPFSVSFRWPNMDEHVRIGDEMLRLIASEAAVSAQSDLAPHLSHRERLYVFPHIEGAEYVALDVTSTIFPVSAYSEYVRLVRTALSSEYGVAFGQDGYLLLRRGELSASIPSSFYTFALPDNRSFEDMERLDIGFAEGVRLLGYEITQQRNAVIRPVTYWRVESELGESLGTALFIRDGISGEITRGPMLSRTEHWISLSDLERGALFLVDYGWLSVPASPSPEVGVSVLTGAMETTGWVPIERAWAGAELGEIVPLRSYHYRRGYLFGTQ